MSGRPRFGPNGTRVWLLKITWKRRKGKPSDYIAATSGGCLQVLLMHQELAKRLKVPWSWIEFSLHTNAQFKKLAPELYAQWVEMRAAEEKKPA